MTTLGRWWKFGCRWRYSGSRRSAGDNQEFVHELLVHLCLVRLPASQELPQCLKHLGSKRFLVNFLRRYVMKMPFPEACQVARHHMVSQTNSVFGEEASRYHRSWPSSQSCPVSKVTRFQRPFRVASAVGNSSSMCGPPRKYFSTSPGS